MPWRFCARIAHRLLAVLLGGRQGFAGGGHGELHWNPRDLIERGVRRRLIGEPQADAAADRSIDVCLAQLPRGIVMIDARECRCCRMTGQLLSLRSVKTKESVGESA